MRHVTCTSHRILINSREVIAVPEGVTGMIQLPVIQMCSRDSGVLPNA